MHDESGLKNTEMQPFWHDVFSDIKQTHPNLRLDLRAKGLPDEVIDDASNLGLKAKITTKYWMEQMGLPFHPTHINTEDQRNRRHSYADLLRYPQRYHVHWRLWNGGTTRVLLWGDPDYVRRFADTARLYDGDGFEINEPLATKMDGEPHDEKPFDILTPPTVTTTTSSNATGSSTVSGAASPTIPRPPPKSGSTSSPRVSDRRRARP